MCNVFNLWYTSVLNSRTHHLMNQHNSQSTRAHHLYINQ